MNSSNQTYQITYIFYANNYYCFIQKKPVLLYRIGIIQKQILPNEKHLILLLRKSKGVHKNVYSEYKFLNNKSVVWLLNQTN